MRQTITLTLAALLLAGALTGCAGGTGKDDKPPLTPEARTELYRHSIEEARDQEMNKAVPVITSEEGDLADLILPMFGVSSSNCSAFAVAGSAVNIRAYGVAAVLPAAGKDEEVLEGLNSFIDTQKANFERYLADQYEIARNARLETLEDGTLLLVMSENQDALFDAIRDAVEQAA